MVKKLIFAIVLIFTVSWARTETNILNFNIYPYNFIISGIGTNTKLPSIKLIQTALDGYRMLVREHSVKRPEVITIIDFSLPSDEERLWVLDLKEAKMMYHCLVAHGLNSGGRMAEYFSNRPGSGASSLGFYRTGESYFGKNGLSLALDGLEPGINDKARERAIVIHGASYVSADFVKKRGMLGRSFGCPALPVELNEKIIRAIKGGSCLFVYAPTEGYLATSPIINRITPIKPR